jgi:phosphonate transport system ATP-binding protein
MVKGYPHGVQALGGVSFSVRPGELVAVLGPSGAGKTTLFRWLTRLTRPDAGQVFIHGRDICRIAGRELRMARRDVALIFQQFNLIRRLTAVQNVLADRLASLSTWRVVARRFPRADRQIAHDRTAP